MKFKNIFPLLLVMASTAPSAVAVTDKEMDQARAIAAQCYLRYANDGSGYLDEFRAGSMAELEGKLKAKEKENIKAFKSIQSPSDYASWDKKKLVEYWSKTVFESPKLEAKGKSGRLRARARLNELSVAAPAPDAGETKPEEKTAQPEPETAPESAPVAAAEAALAGEAGAVKAEADSLVAAAEEDMDVVSVKPEDNSTWIYVAILVGLVAIVIALVAYAAKTLKSSGGKHGEGVRPGSADDAEAEIEALREKFGKALGNKNDELAKVSQALNAERERSAMLESRLAAAEAAAAALRAEIGEIKAGAVSAGRPEVSEPRESAARKRIIYLGRVNAKGIFVRADRHFDPSHDVYCLETSDGMTGSFYVVSDPTLAEMAMLSLSETLGGGCAVSNPSAVGEATEIQTDMRGTAVFEGGCWRVSRKASVSLR